VRNTNAPNNFYNRSIRSTTPIIAFKIGSVDLCLYFKHNPQDYDAFSPLLFATTAALKVVRLESLNLTIFALFICKKSGEK
ncbi:hypothetical protein, partial [Testudinibacter sp. TR-2022]|uniref:hypothetical protein n=1 Tax=Testudinibacter sp. TR-2022 TaxID=2585029 RepID=UPI002279712A